MEPSPDEELERFEANGAGSSRQELRLAAALKKAIAQREHEKVAADLRLKITNETLERERKWLRQIDQLRLKLEVARDALSKLLQAPDMAEGEG